MSGKFDQKVFEQWLSLRETLKVEKRDKNYSQIIKVSLQILDLDRKAKFIGIMVPIFLKEIGNAYLKLGNVSSAIEYLQLAKDGLAKYRATEKLSHPDDWLKDINSLEKNILKLRSKSA